MNTATDVTITVNEESRTLPAGATCRDLVQQLTGREVGADGRLTKVVESAPLIELDSKYYKTIGKFEDRFPDGAPSLKEATGLAVKGDWTFADDVKVVGAVSLDDPGEPRTVASGTTLL